MANLGNFANQLTMGEREDAVQNVGATSPAWADVSQAASTSTLGGTQPQQPAQPQQQGNTGWDQTRKYLGAVSKAGGEENQNGLSKVLGLVGLFA